MKLNWKPLTEKQKERLIPVLHPKTNPMARKKSNTSKPPAKKPIAVKALEAAEKHFDKTTPEGRYILARLETKASHAVKRALKPKKKLTPYQKAVKHTDETFQKYTRLKDSKEFNFTHFKCCTCNKIKDSSHLQAGHCIERRSKGSMATRWEENNAHGQCDWCNSPHGGHGEREKHEAYIVRKHGQKELDRLLVMEKLGGKNPSLEKVIEVGKKYEAKIKSLKG